MNSAFIEQISPSPGIEWSLRSARKVFSSGAGAHTLTVLSGDAEQI
jgi:hypothetical protein